MTLATMSSQQWYVYRRIQGKLIDPKEGTSDMFTTRNKRRKETRSYVSLSVAQIELHRDARLTLRVISGLDDSWLVVGYATPAKFQTIGLLESPNSKLDTSVASTTSVVDCEQTIRRRMN